MFNKRLIVQMWFTAGVHDLRPSESEPHEPVCVQLAGATTSNQANARASLGRACQSQSSCRSLAAYIKAFW